MNLNCGHNGRLDDNEKELLYIHLDYAGFLSVAEQFAVSSKASKIDHVPPVVTPSKFGQISAADDS